MDQLGQIGGLGPITKSPLTARRTGAGNHRHQQRLANGQTVADLRLPLCVNGAVDTPRYYRIPGPDEAEPLPHRQIRRRFSPAPACPADGTGEYRRLGPDGPTHESPACRLYEKIRRCGNSECRATGRPAGKPYITYIP